MEHMGGNLFQIGGRLFRLIYLDNSQPVLFDRNNENTHRIETVIAIANTIFSGNDFPPQNTRMLTREQAILRNQPSQTYTGRSTIRSENYQTLKTRVTRYTHALDQSPEAGGGEGVSLADPVAAAAAHAPRDVPITHQAAMRAIFDIFQGLNTSASQGNCSTALSLEGKTPVNDPGDLRKTDGTSEGSAAAAANREEDPFTEDESNSTRHPSDPTRAPLPTELESFPTLPKSPHVSPPLRKQWLSWFGREAKRPYRSGKTSYNFASYNPAAPEKEEEHSQRAASLFKSPIEKQSDLDIAQLQQRIKAFKRLLQSRLKNQTSRAHREAQALHKKSSIKQLEHFPAYLELKEGMTYFKLSSSEYRRRYLTKLPGDLKFLGKLSQVLESYIGEEGNTPPHP